MPDQLEELVELRIKVLRSANGLPEDADLSRIKEQSRRYFREGFEKDSFAVFFAYEGSEVVGCGGVSCFDLMPTCDFPSGKAAYIMNMYTEPAYRRRGIASALLERIVGECRSRGIEKITLEATDMGRPLYEKHGFVSAGHEMVLPER
ncbi:Ribosomal protein S18 acetylase RimI [Ruminococcaceae bacterium FB2012]|nr:Ribosomal protein S18 acetylase RimI [Ruminococcaceae bacterium FB2012]